MIVSAVTVASEGVGVGFGLFSGLVLRRLVVFWTEKNDGDRNRFLVQLGQL